MKMEVPSRKVSAVLDAATLTLLAASALGLLVIDHMDGVALFGLAICGLVFWIVAGKSWAELPRPLLWGGLIFAALPFAAEASMLTNAWNDTGFSMLGRVGRWFCFVPVVMAIWSVRVRLTQRVLGWLLLLGCVVAAAVAAYQVFGREIQASGNVGVAIVFGDVLAIQAFAGFYLLLKCRRNAFDTAVLIAGGASALGGVAMSGSRGALTILIVLLAFLWALTARLHPLRSAILAVVGAAIVGAVIFSSPMLSVRYAQSLHELASLRSSVATDRSGSRPEIVAPCLNSAAVLESLIGRAVTKGQGRISLLGTQSIGKSFPWLHCRGNIAIGVENTSPKGMFVVHFPRAVPIGRPAPAIAIVSGRGRLRTANAVARKDVTVNTPSPRIVEIRGAPGQSGYLTVILAPHERLEIIPIQSVPGEYVFPRAEGSLAKRIRLWTAALESFSRHPLHGRGLGSFRTTTTALAAAGGLPSYLGGTYEHPHNDLLWMLQWGGITGALAYCAVVLLPMFWFWRSALSGAMDRTMGTVGAGICLGVLVGGVTETLFAHALFNSWLIIVFALILVCGYADREVSKGIRRTESV